jgi:hypothetical protein
MLSWVLLIAFFAVLAILRYRAHVGRDGIVHYAVNAPATGMKPIKARAAPRNGATGQARPPLIRIKKKAGAKR